MAAYIYPLTSPVGSKSVFLDITRLFTYINIPLLRISWLLYLFARMLYRSFVTRKVKENIARNMKYIDLSNVCIANEANRQQPRENLHYGLIRFSSSPCISLCAVQSSWRILWRSSIAHGRSGAWWTLTAQNPHEDELDNVGVDEQKLGAAVALGACYRVHWTGAHGGVACWVGKEDVFERAEL